MKPFSKVTFVVAATCLLVGIGHESHGALGIYESYAVLNANGGGNTFYDAQASTGNPDYQGAFFGTFDPGLGNTLLLNGGEVKTYKNDGGDVYSASLAYRIWSGAESGSFANTDLSFNADLGGGDQKWQSTGAGIDILDGLSAGDYTLEIYFSIDSNEGIKYDNMGGLNYEAGFTVVPEPTHIALGIFGVMVGGAGLVSRLRHRKNQPGN